MSEIDKFQIWKWKPKEKEENKNWTIKRERELKKKLLIFFIFSGKKVVAANHFNGTWVYQEIHNFAIEQFCEEDEGITILQFH